MRFSRQEYWSELPFPSPWDIPDPWIEPVSPELAGRFLTTRPPGKPTSFFFMAESHSIVCIYQNLFVHYLLMDIWTVYPFRLQWRVLLWTCVYRCLLEYLFSIIWGYKPRNKSAGSHGNYIFNFKRFKPQIANPIAAETFYILTSNVQWFQFLTVSPTLFK